MSDSTDEARAADLERHNNTILHTDARYILDKICPKGPTRFVGDTDIKKADELCALFASIVRRLHNDLFDKEKG